MKIVVKDREQLTKLLVTQGYSLRKFSKEINITSGYLSQIISHKRNPSPMTAKRIAEGLGKKITDIFFIENAYKSEQTSR